MTSETDNRTTELRISEPLRGFIRHQSNRAYIDGGQARWLTKIADDIDAKHEQAVAATLGSDKPPYDELLRCLENDWHISASWDGLRKFWCIELTEEGVRMRDGKSNSRAERTCRIEDRYYDELWEATCTRLSCGHDVWSEVRNYCPECGARIEVIE